MRQLMPRCLLYISLLLFVASGRLHAQVPFPKTEGENVRYMAYIEMPKGYVSGICVLHLEGDTIHGALFNEFGITALDFSYNLVKKKMILHTVMPMMDKWYIRKVLKKDLRQLMDCLQHGETIWTDERYHIVYQLTPLL